MSALARSHDSYTRRGGHLGYTRPGTRRPPPKPAKPKGPSEPPAVPSRSARHRRERERHSVREIARLTHTTCRVVAESTGADLYAMADDVADGRARGRASRAVAKLWRLRHEAGE